MDQSERSARFTPRDNSPGADNGLLLTAPTNTIPHNLALVFMRYAPSDTITIRLRVTACISAKALQEEWPFGLFPAEQVLQPPEMSITHIDQLRIAQDRPGACFHLTVSM